MTYLDAQANFDSVETIHNKVQNSIYDLYNQLEPSSASVIDQYDVNSILELIKQIQAKVSSTLNKIQKAQRLLDINSAICEDMIELDLRLNYIAKIDRLTYRFKELKLRIQCFQLYDIPKYKSSLIEKTRSRMFKNVKEDIEKDKDITFLSSGKSNDKTLETLSVNDKILKTNKTITSILQSSHGVMESNLMSSNLAISKFDESTNSLIHLTEKYDFIADRLVSSKKLVDDLKKADNADLRKMKLALFFFSACCLWILWRRILKYPVKLIFWFLWKGIVLIFYLGRLSKNTELKSFEVFDDKALYSLVSKILENSILSDDNYNSITDNTIQSVIEASFQSTWIHDDL